VAVADQSENLAELVKEKNTESAAYLRQLVVWLGVGSGAGAIAMASWAAHLPNPDYAFHFLLPSLWSFLVGVMLAGVSPWVLSKKLQAEAEHFADAHNRHQIHSAIEQIPEFISAPQHLADTANVARNELIKSHDKFHAEAEKAWNAKVCWGSLWLTCTVISFSAFIFGFAWPLIQLSAGKTLVP
jgi:zinc transporter ZupT